MLLITLYELFEEYFLAPKGVYQLPKNQLDMEQASC